MTNITCKSVAERNVKIVEEEIHSVVWALKQVSDRGEPIKKLTAQLKRESMNVVMRMLFSKRFGSKLPPRFQELRNAIEFIFKNLSSGNPGDMIPALRVFPTKMLRDMKRVVKRRDEVLSEMIEEHKKGFDKTKPPRDFVDRLFLDDTLNDDERHVVIWDIIFGGTWCSSARISIISHFHVSITSQEYLTHTARKSLESSRLNTISIMTNI